MLEQRPCSRALGVRLRVGSRDERTKIGATARLGDRWGKSRAH